MNFEYMFLTQAQDSIDIENPGNCCINVFNDNAEEYYLTVKTDLGFTTVETFGPLTVDMNDKGNYFNYNFTSFGADEKKIYQTIYKFLNDDRKAVTQVFEIEPEVAQNRLKEIFR